MTNVKEIAVKKWNEISKSPFDSAVSLVYGVLGTIIVTACSLVFLGFAVGFLRASWQFFVSTL